MVFEEMGLSQTLREPLTHGNTAAIPNPFMKLFKYLRKFIFIFRRRGKMGWKSMGQGGI